MARSASQPANPGTAALRDAASKVVNHDMPLYMACPCRAMRPYPAQLTRLHVVTPKAPLHVVLNPRVRPCPDAPVFHPGWSAGSASGPQPRKLPHNSVLVLRLPFVYAGERE